MESFRNIETLASRLESICFSTRIKFHVLRIARVIAFACGSGEVFKPVNPSSKANQVHATNLDAALGLRYHAWNLIHIGWHAQRHQAKGQMALPNSVTAQACPVTILRLPYSSAKDIA